MWALDEPRGRAPGAASAADEASPHVRLLLRGEVLRIVINGNVSDSTQQQQQHLVLHRALVDVQ